MKKIFRAIFFLWVIGLVPLMAQEKRDMPMKSGGMHDGSMMMGNMKEMQGKMAEMHKGMNGMMKGQRMMKSDEMKGMGGMMGSMSGIMGDMGHMMDAGKMTPEEMEELIQGPPKGNVSRTSFTKLGVKHINKVVVQCAEDLVFSPNQSSGIEALVQKYSRWRIEMDYVEIPNEDENSLIQGSIMSVREIENAAANNG